MYKVPRRDIYCNTILQWLLETTWCFVVIKVFPGAVDFGPGFKVGESKQCPYCNGRMDRGPGGVLQHG